MYVLEQSLSPKTLKEEIPQSPPGTKDRTKQPGPLQRSQLPEKDNLAPWRTKLTLQLCFRMTGLIEVVGSYQKDTDRE